MTLALTIGILSGLLLAACIKVERLQAEVLSARAREHALCLTHIIGRITEVVSAEHDAVLLRRMADLWDSPDEQFNLPILAREEYQHGGPSMPAIWLRKQATALDSTTDRSTV